MPRYTLQPPNDGVIHFHDLKFGRGDYEQERLEYSKAHGRWWPHRDTQPKPTHWRERVGDRWALIPINEHPEKILSGYNRPILYPTELYVELLFETPSVIQAVQFAAEERASGASMKKLHMALSFFMTRVFKPKWEEWRAAQLAQRKEIEARNVTTFEDDGVTWNKVFQVYEYSIELIADWLLVNYETYTLEWSERILRHIPQDAMSPQWRAYLEAIERKERPQIKRQRTFGKDAVPFNPNPQPQELSSGNSSPEPKRTFRSKRDFSPSDATRSPTPGS